MIIAVDYSPIIYFIVSSILINLYSVLTSSESLSITIVSNLRPRPTWFIFELKCVFDMKQVWIKAAHKYEVPDYNNPLATPWNNWNESFCLQNMNRGFNFDHSDLKILMIQWAKILLWCAYAFIFILVHIHWKWK